MSIYLERLQKDNFDSFLHISQTLFPWLESKVESFSIAPKLFRVETYPKLSDFKMTKRVQKGGVLDWLTLIGHNFSNLSQIHMIQNIKMV